ncbi:MAG: alanine racemase [Nocardiopsaceae bacterium]|nr:alanine racemase [Nocardiopsaceae bacterium]
MGEQYAEAEISLSAIRENTAAFTRRMAPAAVMAVVKADGYGHGAVASARAALDGGATWLGVVHVREALELREAGIGAPVLVMMAIGGDDHAAAVRRGVDLSASTVEMVRCLAKAATEAGRPARVHLKADTGLNRGGATRDDWPSVVSAAMEEQAAGRLVVTGLWSHFASSDDPGNPSIREQVSVFRESIEIAEKSGISPEVRHLGNTAGAIGVPEARFDLVRIGGGIYGLSTLPGGAPGWLTPAMTLKARLIQVKRVPAGAGVSYNHRYVTSRDTTLGLLPLGYADGVPRGATNARLAFTRGRRWQIAGTVCMDQLVIDFGDEPMTAGEEVVLFGPGGAGEPTAQEWGEALGTISYEIVTGIGPRVPRSYTP